MTREPPGPETILRATQVTKRFGGFTAVDTVDFTLGCRERVGLIGPNGSGKSTLLQILSGRVQPDGGDLAVCDEYGTILHDGEVARGRAATRGGVTAKGEELGGVNEEGGAHGEVPSCHAERAKDAAPRPGVDLQLSRGSNCRQPAQFSSLMIRRSVGPLLHRNQEYRQVLPFVIKCKDRGALRTRSPCSRGGL